MDQTYLRHDWLQQRYVLCFLGYDLHYLIILLFIELNAVHVVKEAKQVSLRKIYNLLIAERHDKDFLQLNSRSLSPVQLSG